MSINIVKRVVFLIQLITLAVFALSCTKPATAPPDNPSISNLAGICPSNLDGGPLDCSDPTCAFLSACRAKTPACGNGQLDEGEPCDGALFTTQNCIDVAPSSFTTGRLFCAKDCTLDFSDCQTTRIVPDKSSGHSKPGTRPIVQLFPERLCFDRVDNNQNGVADQRDPDCQKVIYGDGKPVYGPENDEYRCSDGIDNDGSGFVDCDDPACVAVAPCNGQENCVNCKDDDGNGLIDCADPACTNDLACVSGTTEVNCFDGKDNDVDGKTDCADLDCLRLVVNNCNLQQICAPENTPEICADTFDNDGSGFIDCKDPQCVAALGSGCAQCTKDADCDDNNGCTKDVCDTTNSRCTHETDTTVVCCKIDSDCTGTNECQQARCDNTGKCTLTTLPDKTRCGAITPSCQPNFCESGVCTITTPLTKAEQDALCAAEANDACETAVCAPGIGADPINGCLVTTKTGVPGCCVTTNDCGPSFCNNKFCNLRTLACESNFSNEGNACSVFPNGPPILNPPDPAFPFYPLCQPGLCTSGLCVQKSLIPTPNAACPKVADCDQPICAPSDARRNKITGCLDQRDDRVCLPLPDPHGACLICDPLSPQRLPNDTTGCAPCDDGKACTVEKCAGSGQQERCESEAVDAVCNSLNPVCVSPNGGKCNPSATNSDKDGCIYCDDNNPLTTDTCSPFLPNPGPSGCRNARPGTPVVPGIKLCVAPSTEVACSGTTICDGGNMTDPDCAVLAKPSNLSKTDAAASVTFVSFAQPSALPGQPSKSHVIDVSWGDGSLDSFASFALAPGQLSFGTILAHNYNVSGKYSVTITLRDIIDQNNQAVFTVPLTKVLLPSGQSSTDLFDSSRGTVIVNSDAIIDPINAFRTSGGFENGNTLMRNGGLNSVSFITFDTLTSVRIGGVRLFAANDQDGCCLRRAMNQFRLLADTDNNGTFETIVIDTAINPTYSSQAGNVATGLGKLDITLRSSRSITSRHWRLETTQGSNIQPFEGVRIIEVDAIPAI